MSTATVVTDAGSTSSSGASTTSTGTTRATPATPRPDVPVNPGDFERAGMSVFTYIVGARTGTCAISPHGATCQGTTPSDAPVVTAVPLPPRKADAIYVGEDGMHYTVFEGVGPSQGTLDHGRSISVRENLCRYPDDNTLTCISGMGSFTISADGAIAPHGQLHDPPVWTLPDYY